MIVGSPIVLSEQRVVLVPQMDLVGRRSWSASHKKQEYAAVYSSKISVVIDRREFVAISC